MSQPTVAEMKRAAAMALALKVNSETMLAAIQLFPVRTQGDWKNLIEAEMRRSGCAAEAALCHILVPVWGLH